MEQRTSSKLKEMSTLELQELKRDLEKQLSSSSVDEAEWSSSFINDLPDSSFAVIEPGGRKDEQGKTVPRSLRHFPYKDAQGNIDKPHLRNALARLSQAKISPQLKAAARKKLVAASKEVGIETSLDEQLKHLLMVTDVSSSSDSQDLAEVAGDGSEAASLDEKETHRVTTTTMTEKKMSEQHQEQEKTEKEHVGAVKESTIPTATVNLSSSSSSSTPVTVKLDASEFKEVVSSLSQLMTSNAKESAGTPHPKALVSATEADSGGVKPVEESKVMEKKRYERIWQLLKGVKEDISSSVAAAALGQEWLPDAIVLPSDLPANLRQFSQVQIIPKGAKQVNWVTVTTPAFGALTEDTNPTDVSQTIAGVSATPTETGAKQRVSYITMESSTPDLVAAIERAFLRASLIDEDAQILTALDAATPAATLYGDETVNSESQITSSMTFAAKRLASALREITRKGYVVMPGDAVAVLHPVQYDALLKDSNITQYLYFGSTGPIQAGTIPQVYGVNVVRSTKVPTGSGSGSPPITTYHAQVFLKPSYQGADGIGAGGTVGLGISRDLLVETWRNIYERALYIVASHRIAAAVLQPNSLVHVYTA
jgi:hypothetical protein